MRVRVFAISLLVLLPTLALAQTGVASFTSCINWSQTADLYFNINNGPPNMSGDLVTFRNGSWLNSPGWITTDANGNAQRGPWSWANTPSDQTDVSLHIHWSNGTDTYANCDHYWDKTCPTVSISNASPSAGFSGPATDNQWGAGFNGNWTNVHAHFADITSGAAIYWDGTSYNPSAPQVSFAGTVSPLPSHSATWSVSAPPPSAHISSHTYQWTVIFADGDNNCNPRITSSTFTY